MPLPSLRSIFATPLHSAWAVPLACSVGAGAGAAVSLAFRGCTNLVPDALVGGWLAIGWTNVQRYLDPGRAMAQLQPHERALVDYPAVRQRLHEVGTSVDDLDALKSLAGQLEREFGRMITQFNAYCHSREVSPNPLMAGVIRHFYLTHCGERGIVLLSRLSATACYLVAAHAEQGSAIADGLSQKGVTAGTVLRRLRCPYLRVDLANETLHGAQSFTTNESHGEMRVCAHPSPFEVGPLVEVTNRRSTGQHGAPRAAPPPFTQRTASGSATPAAEVVASVGQARSKVCRGPLLRAKLLGLAADSRTWRELNRIEDDLAANRPCGHPVRYHGEHYQANDIHWEGRQSPGRNAWRLLHRKGQGGHELVDIVDYHRPRT
ncbi:hypothetical protein J7J08_12585 [Stenotrophomonas sp. ISL-67]|uniref:hypothetical protein n=1 Tax=Stenotrophomonas sp. ISL-67 TaxID=2819171 RepID=UPI001BEBF924|nr:hypothetical protein [Stenotrophomonas sp. ISL-67]MBT2768475.1 hypothetical protein [Stenotrophomonas sp. ISL-67]